VRRSIKIIPWFRVYCFVFVLPTAQFNISIFYLFVLLASRAAWMRWLSLFCLWFSVLARPTDGDVFHCRYFCITPTTVKRHYFTAMKNRTTSVPAQTRVTKTVNRRSSSNLDAEPRSANSREFRFRFIPHLFDCKSRLINFLKSLFRAAYKRRWFTFISLPCRMVEMTLSLSYVLSTKLSFRILFLLFSITCTCVTGGIMMNRRQLW